MRLRTVTYRDGRCEIIQVLNDDQLQDWSKSDPLAFEASIMWLYPPEKIPYVRVLTVRNCKSRRGRLSTGGNGRVLGYSRLTSDAPFNGDSGGFVRRVFYVREDDLQNNRIIADRIPKKAVTPTSLAPGIHGEHARSQVTRHADSKRPSAAASPFDNDVSDWIGEEPEPLVSDAETDIQEQEVGTDVELATDSRGRILGFLVPISGKNPIPLAKTDIHMGRSQECDIVVNDVEVSGLHCELTYEDGRWFVRDVGSTNGTFVDSEPLEVGERRQLAHGAVLSVSKVAYRLET